MSARIPTLPELIGRAPWREAVTYRETWPHEYVLSEKDGQQELLGAICDRFRAGEGVACRFFRMNNTYLFIGDFKYWLMTHWDDLEPGEDYVLNRARLYRDRRDFVIQPGDSGKPHDYPVNPAYQGRIIPGAHICRAESEGLRQLRQGASCVGLSEPPLLHSGTTGRIGQREVTLCVREDRPVRPENVHMASVMRLDEYVESHDEGASRPPRTMSCSAGRRDGACTISMRASSAARTRHSTPTSAVALPFSISEIHFRVTRARSASSACVMSSERRRPCKAAPISLGRAMWR